MKRISKHIAILSVMTFAVSAVGLPIAVYYCTMLGAYRTGECCCACPSKAPVHTAAISARPCVEPSDVGSPLASAFTIAQVSLLSVHHAIVCVMPVNPIPSAYVVCIARDKHCRDGIPPPLLRSTLLRI